MHVYNRISNHATFGGDAQDRSPTANDAAKGGDGQQQQPPFSGMSAAERYELDTFGVLHLRSVLSPRELTAAQAAFDRLHRPGGDRGDDDSGDGQADGMGGARARGQPSLLADFSFAAEAALEQLAAHPRLLPVLLELCCGAPHLVSGVVAAGGGDAALVVADGGAAVAGKPAAGARQLHCQREYDHRYATYTAEAPGRCRCDNFVVFPYLDSVSPEAADGGGLLLLPGSHRSQFSRPRTLFGPFGKHEEEWAAMDWSSKSSGASAQTHSPAWHDVPEALVNLCPQAGDFIILPEATCHGVLPWPNTQHGCRILSLHFKSGAAFAAHASAHGGPDQPSGGVLDRLSLDTRALIGGHTAELHSMLERACAGASFRAAPDPGAVPPPIPQRRCWRHGHTPTATDDGISWPELTEFTRVANDAVYANGHRDRVLELGSGQARNSTTGEPAATTEATDSQCGGIDQNVAGALTMTPEQRFLFDAQGYVILRGVLSADELAAARAAFARVLRTSHVPPPGGTREPSGPARSNVDGQPIREPALEGLASHPRLLPILAELGHGAPHLTACTMVYHPPHTGPPLTCEMYGQIHCHRENSPPTSGRISYSVREPGYVSTDDLNVFPYLDSVQPGDGGLAVIPGSHKAMFSRPRSMFWPYSNSGESPLFGSVGADARDHLPPETPAQLQRQLISVNNDGACRIQPPDGLVQLALQAGDYVVMSEMTSHCILPWQPTDRCRRALTLRYYSGAALAHQSKGGRRMDADLEEWIEHVSPLTRAMLNGVAFLASCKASL